MNSSAINEELFSGYMAAKGDPINEYTAGTPPALPKPLTPILHCRLASPATGQQVLSASQLSLQARTGPWCVLYLAQHQSQSPGLKILKALRSSPLLALRSL